jgi:uncharacterized protein
MTITRRDFLARGAIFGGALAAFGPFQALSGRTSAQDFNPSVGYGPLENKGDLWLPAEFNYQVISVQGTTMSDGNPVPGIFDGMAAFDGRRGTTILIRNHENREQEGEIKVLTPDALQHDVSARGGNTKLVVHREKSGFDFATKQPLYKYEVLEEFAILGGTSTNCAGGLRDRSVWITCEEVVKRTNGIKHGYIFEVDAYANGPISAVPVTQAGRRAHEAALEWGGIVYITEDRSISDDTVLGGQIGACLYRYVQFKSHDNWRAHGWSKHHRRRPLAETEGALQALRLEDEPNANMNSGRVVGSSFRAAWVTIDEPDHDDDTDSRLDRVPGFTPNRVQAKDRGAAIFDRLEGIWADHAHGTIYFVTTSGGAAGLGQVWEYDPRWERLTLIYESTDASLLQSPDNVVVVPQTHHIFLCEDGDDEQFVRGVTPSGEIYDFARTTINESEFCGACFDPNSQTLYLNQQGARGNLPLGTPEGRAVTYAIYGPFEKRSHRR